MGAGLREWIGSGLGWERGWGIPCPHASLGTFWTVLGLKGPKFQIFTAHGLQTPV